LWEESIYTSNGFVKDNNGNYISKKQETLNKVQKEIKGFSDLKGLNINQISTTDTE
jgi:hypothetical protein